MTYPIIALGSLVRILDLNNRKETSFRIVPPAQAAPAEGLISIASPIASSLIGKAVDEIAEATTPRGTRQLQVLEIS